MKDELLEGGKESESESFIDTECLDFVLPPQDLPCKQCGKICQVNAFARELLACSDCVSGKTEINRLQSENQRLESENKELRELPEKLLVKLLAKIESLRSLRPYEQPKLSLNQIKSIFKAHGVGEESDG